IAGLRAARHQAPSRRLPARPRPSMVGDVTRAVCILAAMVVERQARPSSSLISPLQERGPAGPPGPGAVKPSPTLRERAFAYTVCACLGVLAYQSHIRQGGFYLDDWANGAGALYPPGGATLGHALTYFSDLTLYRPVL